MAVISATCQAVEFPTGVGAPGMIHLLPIGSFAGRDGRTWMLDDAAGVIRRFEARGVDLPIDYEHQSEMNPEHRSGPVPAAGWITSLEMRDDGIWGRAKWTDKARSLITAGEYRYISPTFTFSKSTRQVMRLKGAGLVPVPTLELTALAREERSMDNGNADMARIAQALGLEAEASVDDVLVALNSASQPDPALFVPIEAVKDLMKDRTATNSAVAEREVTAAVDAAGKGGHITPGMRGWATALCRQDPDSFAEFVGSSLAPYAHLSERVGLSGIGSLKSGK